jgi:NAD(P)-dependent dehydrogenase (short-subunit alcohol dehydrogenase family)
VTSRHFCKTISNSTTALDNIVHGIRVNAVCPAFVDTPMLDRVVEQQPFLPAMIEKHCPLGRAAAPDEIASSVVFLCTPAASYINGSFLTIDAGLTLTVIGA